MELRKLGLIGLACFLAACGGGNGNGGVESGGAVAQQPSGPKTYVAASSTVGDYYSYKEVQKLDGQDALTDYFTRLVSRVDADGAKSTRFLADYVVPVAPAEPLIFNSTTWADELDSQGRVLSYNDGCTTTFKPALTEIAPYAITAGINWQHTGIHETQCGTGKIRQATIDYKNSVGALEQVTVAAGTFSAFKVSRSSTSDNGTTTTVGDRTCWWEPDLGVEIKCVINMVLTNKASGASSKGTNSYELQGFSNQKLARKVNTVQRFMGTWNGGFSGSSAGTCALTFDQEGKIEGNCNGGAVSFDIVGSIDAEGKLALSVASNGTVGKAFSGKVDNVQQISGVWSVANFGSGTWVLKQD